MRDQHREFLPNHLLFEQTEEIQNGPTILRPDDDLCHHGHDFLTFLEHANIVGTIQFHSTQKLA